MVEKDLTGHHVSILTMDITVIFLTLHGNLWKLREN